MKVTINGDDREIAPDTTIAAFLEERKLKPQMVVVEHNGEIVPRDRFGGTIIGDGDTLEIVQMMAGG